jgi:carbonic anhydrase/acetyltransferase-like protein (isoleucine patch superfamily)
MLMGTPAKVVRELNDEERARVRWAAEHHVQTAQRYTTQFRSQEN